MKKRKIRHDFKVARIIALCLIILMSVFGIIHIMYGRYFEEEIITDNNLKNQFSYSYKIDTVENEFVDYSDVKAYTAYVTKLIDNLEFDYQYKFENETGRRADIKYKYNITGKLLGFYTKNGEEQKVIEKDYTIVPTTENSLRGSNFNLEEKFQIDLNPLNELINNFKVAQDIQITSVYDVVLDIEIEGVTNEAIHYSPKVSIEIGGKTTKITGENNRVEQITVDLDNELVLTESQKVYVVILSIIILIAIIRLIYLNFFTEEMLIIKNEYKASINEIIRNCQDKIVVVNNLPEYSNKHIIEIDDIEELIKLSEELYKPILCYENDEETSTQFIVTSDETVYKFIIYKTFN